MWNIVVTFLHALTLFMIVVGVFFATISPVGWAESTWATIGGALIAGTMTLGGGFLALLGVNRQIAEMKVQASHARLQAEYACYKEIYNQARFVEDFVYKKRSELIIEGENKSNINVMEQRAYYFYIPTMDLTPNQEIFTGSFTIPETTAMNWKIEKLNGFAERKKSDTIKTIYNEITDIGNYIQNFRITIQQRMFVIIDTISE